jgi:outer membrane receptor protein involved in Fe transport
VTPFYSKLSDVGSTQIGTNLDGSSYTPPRLLATTETYGVELEGDADLGMGFNVRTALTLQDSKSKDFAVWVFNAAGPQDDTVSRVPNGESDNTAKIMATTTLSYSPMERFDSLPDLALHGQESGEPLQRVRSCPRSTRWISARRCMSRIT